VNVVRDVTLVDGDLRPGVIDRVPLLPSRVDRRPQTALKRFALVLLTVQAALTGAGTILPGLRSMSKGQLLRHG